MTRRLTVAVGAAALGLGVAVRQRAVLAGVPADLRTPSLRMTMSLRGPRTLRLVRRLLATASAVHPEVEATKHVADGVRVIVHEPMGRRRPGGAVLWIHGGGLVAGVPESDHAWCSGLAASLGVPVVAVDYRLAPEHPFPAALDDCHAVLAWIVRRAHDLGVDPTRVAVAGASAGGGLAAAVCQQALDRGTADVALQLLVYPMLDDRTVVRATRERRRTLVWTVGSNRFGWTSYLGRPPGGEEPRAYAVPARRDDLAGLPPAWIGVGDVDLFRDESVEYARRLHHAGVEVDLQVVPGLFHGADVVWTDRREVTRRFRAAMTEALRAAVAGEVSAT